MSWLHFQSTFALIALVIGVISKKGADEVKAGHMDNSALVQAAIAALEAGL